MLNQSPPTESAVTAHDRGHAIDTTEGQLILSDVERQAMVLHAKISQLAPSLATNWAARNALEVANWAAKNKIRARTPTPVVPLADDSAPLFVG